MAPIQETHIPHNHSYAKYNYKIITSGALKTGTCEQTGKGLHQGGGSNVNTSRPNTLHQHNQENRPQDHDGNITK